MLYQIYEAQRSLMEPFADFAQAASKLYSNPLSPFGQHPFAQRVSAGYDLLYRLGKDYEKPEFGIKTVDVDGNDVAIHERVEIDKPFCELRRFKRFTDDPHTLDTLKGQPAVLIVAPLSGHYATLLRDTVRTMLQGPQGLHHRLEERAHRAAGPGRVPPGRLRQLRAGIHPPPAGRLRQLPRDQRLPAHRAGAGRRVADGQPRRDDAADHDHDGRPDRRPQVAHRGEQPGDEQELRVVREQRDLPRSDQLPGRRPPRVPRLPAAHRLRGDEPRPPPVAATTTTSST